MPLHPLGTLGHGAVTHACPALVALAYACGIMDTCPQTHSQSSIAQCFYCHMIIFIKDDCFLQVLQQAVGGHDAALLVQVLRSVRPDTNQQDKVGTREWSCACLAAVLPGAVRLLHKLLAPSQAAQLSADQLQVTVHFSIHAMGQAY